MLSTAFARAQASFDPNGECLNVVDFSHGQRLGEYGDASINDDAYLVNAFDTNKNDYKNKLIQDLGINIGVCFQIKGW